MRKLWIVLGFLFACTIAAAQEWNEPRLSYGYERPVGINTLVVQLMNRVGTSGRLETSVEGGNLVIVYTGAPQRDDSVHRIRVRLELRETVDGRYVVERAGEQYQCQQGRGQQEFAATLCL